MSTSAALSQKPSPNKKPESERNLHGQGKRRATHHQRLFKENHGHVDDSNANGEVNSSSEMTSGGAKKRSLLIGKKMRFYQRSKMLPTSKNTFRKVLNQRFEILKQAGQFKRYVPVRNPHKKNQSKSSTQENIIESFSISKQALALAHQIYGYYMSLNLKTAQTIRQNTEGITVSAGMLDLASELNTRYIGPKWKMSLVSLDQESTD